MQAGAEAGLGRFAKIAQIAGNRHVDFLRQRRTVIEEDAVQVAAFVLLVQVGERPADQGIGHVFRGVRCGVGYQRTVAVQEKGTVNEDGCCHVGMNLG